jgi:hypothetical protein
MDVLNILDVKALLPANVTDGGAKLSHGDSKVLIITGESWMCCPIEKRV